jgi:hypothetical protein
MMRLALVLLIAGCVAHDPPAPSIASSPVLIELPPDLRTCAGTVRAPPLPPPIRTVERVGAYARSLETALTRAEDARTECARRLNRVVERVDAANLENRR